MGERYDSATARHYAAYRPPLHQRALRGVVDPSEAFKLGLDVGCGTGCSTVALAKYCDRVLGLDSSYEMIDQAESHPKVTYIAGSIDSLHELSGRPYDIVTFAGSLFYLKSDALQHFLLKVCDPGGVVVVYDFSISMDKLLSLADLAVAPGSSDYDCEVDLSDWEGFGVEASECGQARLTLSPEEAAHLFLSDSNRYDAIRESWDVEDPFEDFAGKLRDAGGPINVRAETWAKRYRMAARA